MTSPRRIPANKFERIVGLANEGIWTLDADGRTDYINERGAAILGYRPEEMLGRHPIEFLFPEDQRNVKGIPGMDGREGRRYAEIQACRKDGSTVWLSGSTSPLLGEDGDYQGALAVFSDITDRKMAEEALTFQAHLLTSVHDAIIATDEHFTIIYWNETAHKMLGWSTLEAIGKRSGELLRTKVPGSSREAAVERMMRDGFYDGEVIVCHKDGREIFVDVRATMMRDVNGEISEIVYAFRDIDLRKHAEEALKRSEERYRYLVQFAPTAIFELDFVNMKLKNVNEAMASMTGYSEEELLSMDPIDLISDECKAPFMRRIGEWLDGRRKSEAVEYRIKAKDGRELWGAFDLKPICEHGRITGALIVGHDVTEQRRIREELRRTEERFRTILDNSRDGIYMIDIDAGHFIFTSPAQAEITGFTQEEMANMSNEVAFERVHPEDKCNVTAHQERVMAGTDHGEPMEYRWRVKSGAYRWISDRRRVVRDELGRPTALVGTSRDITERKNEEQALRESEERLSLALAAGHLATWDWRSATGEVVWNDEHFRMLGYGVGEVVPSFEAWVDRIHPEDRSAMQAAFEHARMRGGGWAAEFRSLWPDGTIRWINVQGYFEHDALHRPIRSYGIMIDLTERKMAEEALRESEERLRLHFENSPLAVVEWDADFTVTRWAGEAERMFGWKAEEVMGRTIMDLNLIYPEDIPIVEVTMTELTNRLSDKVASSNRNITKDGCVIECMWYNSVLMDENRNMVSVLSLVLDNTARVEAEKELIRNAEELKRSNAELQQFAYVASHDLQEPLRMVTMFLSLLKDRYRDQLDERAKEYVDYAVDGAERMRQLVNDLLEYSRVETKGRRFAEVDMNVVAAEVKDELRVAIDEVGAEVRIDPLPMVFADGSQMKQLLSNLLSNAIKFCDGRRPVVEVSARGSDGTWVFAVKDNGIGIDPRFKDKLFLMFQRLHTRNEYPGTGIGLAIAKKIVERHGGQIWVESDGKSGSTFFFTLPRIRRG